VAAAQELCAEVAFVGTDGAVTLVDGYSTDPDLVATASELFGL
jgi:hypothetical protein